MHAGSISSDVCSFFSTPQCQRPLTLQISVIHFAHSLAWPPHKLTTNWFSTEKCQALSECRSCSREIESLLAGKLNRIPGFRAFFFRCPTFGAVILWPWEGVVEITKYFTPHPPAFLTPQNRSTFDGNSCFLGGKIVFLLQTKIVTKTKTKLYLNS